jgi:hypothetical protein
MPPVTYNQYLSITGHPNNPSTHLEYQTYVASFGLTVTPSITSTPITASEISNYFSGESSKDTTPKNKIYNLPLMSAFRNKMASKSQEGEIGIEIECEGMNLATHIIDWWVVHQDGSLRYVHDHPPQEYVLRKPISREDVPKALDYLTKKLKQSGSQIVDSHRTSVHVHVNCQKMTLKQIYQYICMYMIFEEKLVEFSGPDRPGNLFCLSAKQGEYFITVLETAIQQENFTELFSDNLRYTSCNTASLGKFGSLEFRSMRGTVDQNLIQTWIDILLILRDKALEYEDPRKIVEDFTTLNARPFLKKIFGGRPDIQAMLLSHPDIHTSLWDGLRMMRDVAYAIKWEKYDPALDKKKEPTNQNPAQENPQLLTWTSNHSGHTFIEKIDEDVFLMRGSSGTYYICNYAPVTKNITFMDSPWTLSGRRKYWVNSNTGDYLHQNSQLPGSANAPIQ